MIPELNDLMIHLFLVNQNHTSDEVVIRNKEHDQCSLIPDQMILLNQFLRVNQKYKHDQCTNSWQMALMSSF